MIDNFQWVTVCFTVTDDYATYKAFVTVDLSADEVRGLDQQGLEVLAEARAREHLAPLCDCEAHAWCLAEVECTGDEPFSWE